MIEPNLVLSDRYRMGKPLGEGGMGAVYLAEDLRLERLVAVKVLRPEFATDPRYLARFNREAKIVAQLSANPHVVTIYDVGTLHTGAPYLVMEYVAGRVLTNFTAGSPALSRTSIIDVGTHVASALGEAHDRGVVHRDLKPANIILLESRTMPFLTKVLDFGIARSESILLPKGDGTAHGALIGTPAYMAPEQAMGEAVTRSDVFALGIILHELAAAELPYESATPLGHIFQHASVVPKRLPQREGKGQWPAIFQDLLAAMMASEPDQRPSALEVLAQLLRVEDEIDAVKTRLINGPAK